MKGAPKRCCHLLRGLATVGKHSHGQPANGAYVDSVAISKTSMDGPCVAVSSASIFISSTKSSKSCFCNPYPSIAIDSATLLIWRDYQLEYAQFPLAIREQTPFFIEFKWIVRDIVDFPTERIVRT